MIWIRKKSTIRSVPWTTREWRDLSLSVIVAFGAAMVGAAINFSQRIAVFFRPHANQPLVQFVIQFLVVWLIAVLVISYLRWQKAALKSAELEDIVDSISPDVFLVVDLQRNILMTSVSVRRMFGRDPAEVLHKKTDLLYADRRCVPNVENEVHDALEKDGFHVGWATGRRKDGRTFPLEIITGILKQHGGSVLLLRDITDRKRAEAEQEKLEAQLRQAAKMESVGRLAGGVAHDFNNMLGVILGHTELAMDQADSSLPLHVHLEAIRKAAQHSADVTRQLLTFARKQVIAPTILDLNDAVAKALNLLCRLIGEDIKLVWRPGNNLRPVKIDPSQVNQILANLCINAQDAIRGGGTITLETGNIAIDAGYCVTHPGCVPGEYVFLSINDEGCGMSPETLAQIFEPFFSTKGVGKGTGLGLATVYGVVKQNNGFIYANSEVGKGTTFTIYLPQVAGEIPETTVARTAETSQGMGETILVVEDEKSLRVICRHHLEALGYKVLVAETAEKALELSEQHPGDIHLLLTDVVLPEMNGRQLAKRICAAKPGVKVMFMSGYTADVIAQRGVLEQNSVFIEKPFTRNDLGRKVRETLETSKVARSIE